MHQGSIPIKIHQAMTQVEQDVAYIKSNFGKGVEQLKVYLESHKLLIFFLTPKMGGKSTYIGFLRELFPEKFTVISAGNIVRNIQGLSDSEALYKLQPIFTDRTNVVLQEIKSADVKNLVSDDVLYKLLLAEINSGDSSVSPESPPYCPNLPYSPNYSLILDGFPRTMVQLDLAFDLIEKLKIQGFVPFVLNIVVSDGVLDKRMTNRRVCAKCDLVGNMDTLQNTGVDNLKFDFTKNEFFLTCPTCQTPLIKKTTDTELSEMAERRKVEKDVYAKMVETAQKSQIPQTTLRTDVLVKYFSGDDAMLNLSNSYQLDKQGQITSESVKFTAYSPQGEVYAYHPRWVVGNIVLEMNLKIRN